MFILSSQRIDPCLYLLVSLYFLDTEEAMVDMADTAVTGVLCVESTTTTAVEDMADMVDTADTEGEYSYWVFPCRLPRRFGCWQN